MELFVSKVAVLFLDSDMLFYPIYPVPPLTLLPKQLLLIITTLSWVPKCSGKLFSTAPLLLNQYQLITVHPSSVLPAHPVLPLLHLYSILIIALFLYFPNSLGEP